MKENAMMSPNDDIPELRGLSQEELVFLRLIEEREQEEDGNGEKITLACGHSLIALCLPVEQRYSYCTQCLHAWMDAEKKKAGVEST